MCNLNSNLVYLVVLLHLTGGASAKVRMGKGAVVKGSMGIDIEDDDDDDDEDDVSKGFLIFLDRKILDGYAKRYAVNVVKIT